MYRRIGGIADRMKRGQEDMKTGEQGEKEDSSAGGQEDRRIREQYSVLK